MDDVRFGYLESGSGPLVLVVHGFADAAHTWDHVRPRIAARGHRAVAVFTRGYAPTSIPPRDLDQLTLTQDLLAAGLTGDGAQCCQRSSSARSVEGEGTTAWRMILAVP